MLKKINQKALQYPLTSIILCCVLMRSIILICYWHVTIFPDSGDYRELSLLLENFNLAGYNGVRTLGYPIIITFLGNNLPLLVALQIIVGIATAVYTYKTLLFLKFRRNIALYTAIILNNLIHLLFYEFCILTETVTIFLVTILAYTTIKLFTNGYKSFGQLLFIGFLCGYLTFIKPFYFFLAPLIYILYTLNHFSFRKIINPALTLPVFSCIAFFGWAYVNLINTGYFTSTTYFGFNVAQNCVQFAEKVPEEYKDIADVYVHHRQLAIEENKDIAMTIWYAQDDLAEKTGLPLPALSDRLNDYGRTAISLNKLAYAKQVLVSWVAFWDAEMYWNYRDFNLPIVKKPFLAIWYFTRFTLTLIKILFLLLTPFYVRRYFKSKTIDVQSIIYCFVWATSILQALVAYGTNGRYCFPFELLIIISVLMTANRYLKKYKPGVSLLEPSA